MNTMNEQNPASASEHERRGEPSDLSTGTGTPVCRQPKEIVPVEQETVQEGSPNVLGGTNPKKKRGRPKGSKNKPMVPAEKSLGDSTERTSTRPRGRPRVLPDSIPKLNPGIALDPFLQGLSPGPSPSILIRKQCQERTRKQREEKAKQLAREVGLQELEQMKQCAEQNKVRCQRAEERQLVAAEKARKKRIEEGQAFVRALKNNEYKPVHKQMSDEDKETVIELLASHSQAQIAKKIGVSQGAVSKYLKRLREEIENPERAVKQKRGRKEKLSESDKAAIARFQFLCNTTDLNGTAKFVREYLHKDVCRNTVAKAIKPLGFRKSDFKEVPIQRNTENTIQLRKQYAERIETALGPTTLYNAIYTDEAAWSRVLSRKAWSVKGWVPCRPEVSGSLKSADITLLLAGLPSHGVLYYELVTGSVTGHAYYLFLRGVVSKLADNDLMSTKRVLIQDNASIHKTEEVRDFLRGEEVSSMLQVEYLPPYSPFLNPIEELFADIKSKVFRAITNSDKQVISLPCMKSEIAKAISNLNKDCLLPYVMHMRTFLQKSVQEQPIFSHEIRDKAHHGDEISLPVLNPSMELLLDSYLPENYSEYSSDDRDQLIRSYGVERLTMEELMQMERL